MSSLTAASAAYTDVAAKLASCVAGDTLVVPAGDATWTSGLNISFGIYLTKIGGGTIYGGVTGSSAFLINYSPTTANIALNQAFELTGFNFDLSLGTYALKIYTNSTVINNKIRIHHNTFTGCKMGFWQIRGRVYGVVDNNTFSGETHFDNYGVDGSAGSWGQYAFEPGTVNQLYYEDNSFTTNETMTTGGQGTSYCFRYNNITLASNVFPLFDAHGNQAGGIYTTLGVELYGNMLTGDYSQDPFLDHRGGKALVFYNRTNSTKTVRIRVTDEASDSICTPVESVIDGTPQRPNHGYFWNNRKNSTVLMTAYEGTDVENLVEENDEFFNYTETFDGTVGVGAGALASRPSTCVLGVGYWSTNQETSEVALTHVGIGPSSILSGTLYIATATNAWAEYYSPYTYPHPLRGEIPHRMKMRFL